jgi:hypothetical protein
MRGSLTMRLTATAAALFVCCLTGCGKPAQLGPDDKAFHEVDALFTAVTARRTDLVDECDARLAGLHDVGKVPDDAHAELQRIIERARDGKWESAADRLRAFMKGQERPAVANQNEPWRRGKGKAGKK